MTMPPKPMTMSASYLAMVRGTRELHQLLAAGKDDSPEADAIRDATDGPWLAIPEVERKRIGNLSEDLYSLVEPPPPPKPMDPQAEAKLREAFEAKNRGEWDRALDLLRRWRAHIDPARVSYLRGSIWLGAGDPATAIVFFEHACQLDPDNELFQGRLLETLETTNPPEAATRAEAVLQNSEARGPVVVLRAADIIFGTARGMPELQAAPIYRRLIPIIERTLARLETRRRADPEHSAPKGLGLAVLATCYREVGDSQRAYDYYSRAIQLDPTNDALLAARGMLMYGADPNSAVDFERAIQLGSRLVLPYALMAHHNLSQGRFDESRRLCERALEMNGSPALMSEVCQWMAIAQAELGFPDGMVRATFDDAIRRDPSNERARRNLAAYDAASRPKDWEIRTEGDIGASGLAETRFSRAVSYFSFAS